MIGLLVFSLILRFWGLDRFNTLVFDEVYYAKFAHNYLSQTRFFDGHPPLSKYIIAVGMWLGNQLPFGQAVKNGLTGGLYAPWTYRWINALVGGFIPLVSAGIAYQLLQRRSYALIAGVFAALDGLFLVESRYALNNVYLVILGLVGWWCLLLALNCRGGNRVGWLILAGMGFGSAVAIKWNGLWFLLGAYGLWILAQGLHWLQQRDRHLHPDRDLATESAETLCQTPLQKLLQLRWWQIGGYLGAIPFLTYAFTWIPHLRLNAKMGFWQDFWALQGEILSYHNRVGSGPDVHPYCSNWYSWLVMWRPVAYFYRITGKGDPLPSEHVLPPLSAEKVIYDVHAMGNPFLWWFSTLAIALVLALALGLMVQLMIEQRRSSQSRSFTLFATSIWGVSPAEQWLVLFLAVNYLANLLPWVRVTRCIFLYHYMGASVFASLALAWLVDRWLGSDRSDLRYIGMIVIGLVGLAFVFWMPIYLGLPLSPMEFQLRMWLRSWV